MLVAKVMPKGHRSKECSKSCRHYEQCKNPAVCGGWVLCICFLNVKNLGDGEAEGWSSSIRQFTSDSDV